MEKIIYSLSIQVSGGPTLTVAGVVEADAYEKLDVTVPAKVGQTAGKAEVTVSAADLAQTKMLVIQASSKDGSLKYKTTAQGATDVPINGPVTLVSGTATGLLGVKPDKLTFANDATVPATVTIFVARKAVT